MTTTNAQVVQPDATAPAGIWDWMDSFPPRRKTFIAVAIIAVAISYLPQLFIPEPLGLLRNAGPGFVVLAILFTWTMREWLPRHLRGVVFTTTVVVTALILVHLLFVKPVHYSTKVGDKTYIATVWFITGWDVANPELQNKTAEQQIRWAGSEPDELRAIWGSTFTAMTVVYTVLYLLAINGIVFSIGGTDLAQSRFFGGDKPAPAPRPANGPGHRGKKHSRVRRG
jgi:hypothetical protein